MSVKKDVSSIWYCWQKTAIVLAMEFDAETC